MRPTAIRKLAILLLAAGCGGGSCGSGTGTPGPGGSLGPLPTLRLAMEDPELLGTARGAFGRSPLLRMILAAGRVPFVPLPGPFPALAQMGPPGQLVHAAVAFDPDGEELARLQLGDLGVAGVSAEVVSHVDEGTQETVDALLLYGQIDAALSHWNPEIDDFGIVEVFPGLRVTRVTRYGRSQTGGGACVASYGSNEILFLEYMPGPGLFGFTTERIRSSDFAGASGNAVCGFRREPGGTTVFATDGSPGQLWKHVPGTLAQSSTPATMIGSLGMGPRDIAFEGEIGVVSNFVSGTLAIVRWDAITDEVTILGIVDVGDGPIGLDLRVDANGDLEVSCTGFNDHTYTFTTLSSAGAVLTGPVTRPLPDGALNPVQAVFVDDEGTRIAVSCNGSDEVVMFDRPAN